MQRFNSIEVLKQKTVLHVLQFKNPSWHCGEHFHFLTFLKSKKNLLPHYWWDAWCARTNWCSSSPAFRLQCRTYFSLIPSGLGGSIGKRLSFNALYHLANTKFIKFIVVFKRLFCSLWNFLANEHEKCGKKPKNFWFLVDSARSYPCTFSDALTYLHDESQNINYIQNFQIKWLCQYFHVGRNFIMPTYTTLFSFSVRLLLYFFFTNIHCFL